MEVEQEFEELNEQLFNAQQRVHEQQQSLNESEAKRWAADPPFYSVPPDVLMLHSALLYSPQHALAAATMSHLVMDCLTRADVAVARVATHTSLADV